MNRLTETMFKGDIELAQRFTGWTQTLKILLALAVCIAYFMHSPWLMELLVFSVVVSLISSLEFFGVYIEKLLEYNTQFLEERQTRNAHEANEYFKQIEERLERLENQCKKGRH